MINNKDEDPDFWNRLADKMREYSDEEILSILRKIKLYEPEAQKIATEEAVRRKLIHSEQDLFSPNFRPEPSLFTIFPHPEKKESILKIIRSMSRALLIAGVIPIVFGFLKFQVAKYAEGSSLILTGLVWMTFMWVIYSRQDRRFWSPLLVILILSALYAGRILVLLKGLRTMDYVIPAILFALVFYSLFYLRKLLKVYR
jgi:hypothetical protein